MNVQATVDDNGHVSGTAACGGAGANCGPANGECNDSSHPTMTTGGWTFGNCRGSGNGGYWTGVSVYCWTAGGSGSGGTSINDAIADVNADHGTAFDALSTDANYLEITLLAFQHSSETQDAVTCAGDACARRSLGWVATSVLIDETDPDTEVALVYEIWAT